jgi:hypothetical protein
LESQFSQKNPASSILPGLGSLRPFSFWLYETFLEKIFHLFGKKAPSRNSRHFDGKSLATLLAAFEDWMERLIWVVAHESFYYS